MVGLMERNHGRFNSDSSKLPGIRISRKRTIKVFSIVRRTYAGVFFELEDKIACVGKTAGFCNFCNGFVGGTQ